MPGGGIDGAAPARKWARPLNGVQRLFGDVDAALKGSPTSPSSNKSQALEPRHPRVTTPLRVAGVEAVVGGTFTTS